MTNYPPSAVRADLVSQIFRRDEDNKVDFTDFTCPNGCKEGACVKEEIKISEQPKIQGDFNGDGCVDTEDFKLFEKALSIGNIVLKKAIFEDGTEGITLSHDTFREQLEKDVKDSLDTAFVNLLDICRNWESKRESCFISYTMRYYPHHLVDAINN